MTYVRRYLDRLTGLLQEVSEAQVSRFADLLEAAWRDDRRVLLMGNGGSAATAAHIVNDLQKCIHCDSGRPLKALCLSDNTSVVLAWANDTEYANVFAPQVECWAEPGDLVIGISGSGNSPNVIRGIQAANERGAHTLGFAGFTGGRLAEAARECIVVPSDNMQQIEDMHMVLLHVIFSELRERTRRAAGAAPAGSAT